LTSLRLSPNQADQIGSEEVLTRVRVGKPGKHEFVRVSVDPEMSIEAAIFEDPEREVYLVKREACSVLPSGIKPVLLVLTVNQHGQPLLWPLALGDGSGRTNPWHQTARDAAELAKEHWTKVAADMHMGCYRIHLASGDLPDPVWPDKTFNELLRLAFRDRVIADPEHPVVRQALGYTL